MTRTTYSAVAIVLHWAIAIAIVGMIPLGFWMHNAIDAPDTQAQAIAAYQLHKSIGLTILLLSFVRLGWRIVNPPPPLPEAMAPWEKVAAHAVHWIFYALIIALPLSGWIYVSAQWRGDGPLNVPTVWFGLINVPHLFALPHAALETRAAVADAAMEAHEVMAKGALALLVLHVAAAFKHHIYDRDHVLAAMVPGLDRTAAPDARRRLALIAGFSAIFIATISAIWAFASPPHAAPIEIAADEAPYDLPHTYEPPAPATPTEPAPLPRVGVLGDPPAAQAPAAQDSAPPAWIVDEAASEIAFTGTHAAVAFRGTFTSWRADIRFDPDNLAGSRAVVTIDTASARDGVSLHEQSLAGREWFDVANHPTATYRTTFIRRREGNEYQALGVLTIKGRDIELDLPFTLTIEGDRATMTGQARISREAADLGQDSDADAHYVSRRIGVEVRVVANRAP